MATIYYIGLTSKKNSVTINLSQTIGDLIVAIAADEGLPTQYYSISLEGSPDKSDRYYDDSTTTLTALGAVDGSVFICTPYQSGTKQERQIQKLEIAAKTRTADGNARDEYNITQLPDTYDGNESGADNNPNTGGLVQGRPWIVGGTPTYNLTRSAASINEGQSVTITLVTSNVANGTVVPYTITGVTSGDIDGASLTGNFVVGTTDAITLTTTEDLTTEGNETLTVTLDVQGNTINVTIVDTSVPPATLEEIFTGETSGGVVTVLETQFEASDGDNFIPNNPADGATFTQWTDANSGTKNANPIGGATTRATYESDIASLQNSLSVVRFDGVNDGLSINPYPNLASKSGITVFALIKTAQETVSVNNLNPRVFSTNVANGIALYYNSTSNLWTVAASSGVGTSTTTNDHTQFHVHTLVYDGSLTGNANRLKYRHNGVQDTLTFAGTVGTTTSASITIMYLGNNNGANYWKGDMAEFLLFTRTLTTPEIAAVESYLTNKWGL